MKTYWDYTEKERTNMSEDMVRDLLPAVNLSKLPPGEVRQTRILQRRGGGASKPTN